MGSGSKCLQEEMLIHYWKGDVNPLGSVPSPGKEPVLAPTYVFGGGLCET